MLRWSACRKQKNKNIPLQKWAGHVKLTKLINMTLPKTQVA